MTGVADFHIIAWRICAPARGACYRRDTLVLAQNILPHAGKVLTEPLFVLTLVAVVSISVALKRATQRRGLALALLAVLTLGTLGTDVVADVLLRSLAAPATAEGSPEVIVVPGAGVRFGTSRELDVLVSENELRVVTGIAAWRRHPAAKLVMSGTDSPGTTSADRMVTLMRDRALCAGVPASAIVLDPESTNTREHALRLREMPGITPATRVGIATSFWHMRRTARVFRRYFRTVLFYPSGERLPTRHLGAFIPSADALGRSTWAIQEWVGIAWYAGIDAWENAHSAVRGAAGVRR